MTIDFKYFNSMISIMLSNTVLAKALIFPQVQDRHSSPACFDVSSCILIVD